MGPVSVPYAMVAEYTINRCLMERSKTASATLNIAFERIIPGRGPRDVGAGPSRKCSQAWKLHDLQTPRVRPRPLFPFGKVAPPHFKVMGMPMSGQRVKIMTASATMSTRLMTMPCLKNSPVVNWRDS